MNRKKGIYPFFSNLKILLAELWTHQKRMTVFLFLRAPVLVLLSFLGSISPRRSCAR